MSTPMNAQRLDHLCIAVCDLEAARRIWEPILGKGQPDEEYTDERECIRVARYYLGAVGLELMASTSPEGPVARWIDAHGEGLMVLSLNVDSTARAVEELTQRGYPVVGGLRPFRDGHFAFVHPRAVNGVLLEVIDTKG